MYQEKPLKDNFIIYSDVIRYKWRDKIIQKSDLKKGEKIFGEPRKGTVLEFNITDCFTRLFKENAIDYEIADLRKAIVGKNLSADFYRDLFYYLFLLTDVRNTISNTEIDYIQCSACGFDSRKGFRGREFNSDANGAYNIARKGIMIVEKINQYAKNNNGDLQKMSWGDLVIGIEEWDKFTQFIDTKWNPISKSQR